MYQFRERTVTSSLYSGLYATSSELAGNREVSPGDASREPARPGRRIRRATVHEHDGAGWRMPAFHQVRESGDRVRDVRAAVPGNRSRAPVCLHDLARADSGTDDHRPSVPQRSRPRRVVPRRYLYSPGVRLAVEPAADYASHEPAVKFHPQSWRRREPPECPQRLLRSRPSVHQGEYLLVEWGAALPGMPGLLPASTPRGTERPGFLGRPLTDYGAMSAAMAAFGQGPLPEIPAEPHATGPEDAGG